MIRVFLILIFWNPAFAYMDSLCLSPVEQLALFSNRMGSGKASFKSKIKSAKRGIRKKERRISQLKDDITETASTLGNSLDSNKLGDDPEKTAQKIAKYMMNRQSDWNCQEADNNGTAFFFPGRSLPSFVPSHFMFLLAGSPFLPLTALCFRGEEASADPVGRELPLRRDVVKFGSQQISTDECEKELGGKVHTDSDGAQECVFTEKCEGKYGDMYFRGGVDSKGNCMCAGELCSDRVRGRKLQKCIGTYKRISKNITIQKEICFCGDQPCSELQQNQDTPYQKAFKKCREDFLNSENRKLRYYDRDNKKCMCRFKGHGTRPCTFRPPQSAPVSALLSFVGTGEPPTDSDTVPSGVISGSVPVPSGVTSGSVPVPAPSSLQPDDSRETCEKWQKDGYFKSRGRVNEKAFCRDFAKNQKDCKDGFDELKRQLKRLKRMEDGLDKAKERLSSLEDKQWEAENSEEDEEKTESSGLCFECLSQLRELNAPSGWQRFGDALSLTAGVGLSIFGLREARRSQRHTNELLALQGFPAENNFSHSLAGLGLGFPFVYKGLQGMGRGSFGCHTTPSPYPHSFPTYPVW